MLKQQESEPQLVNGLYRVNLQGETLDSLQKGGLSIYYYGDRARAAKHETGLSGDVAVYQEGILTKSYGEPWQIQLEMIAEENAKMQRKNPSWTIIVPPNAATAIEVAQKVYREHGFNVLSWYSRVGDGSLVAGVFDPRDGALVDDRWLPVERGSILGVLPLAVHQ